MRAVIQHQFGDPTVVLGVEEIEVPEPGPGQVRLRTLLAAIHNHDLWTVRGAYGFKPEMPARAGTEAVAVVVALGEGVDHLAVGQRVASGGAFGAWAEEFVAPAAGLVPVPDAIPDEVAAQLVSMPFSAISLLESLALSPGDWMVQNAANGAVGRMVAQLAAARDINVIGLVRRTEGVAELADLGIGNVVATDTEGWADQVRELTSGAPIRAGVDSVGGSASGDVLTLLAENGTLVVFGAMQSPVMEISSGDIIFKQAVVKGFWGSTVSREMPVAQRRVLFGELIERIGDGSLTLATERIYPLDEIRAAAAANAQPGRTGKILLQP